jgi:hypothetical protein
MSLPLSDVAAPILCDELLPNRLSAYEFCVEDSFKLRRVISSVLESPRWCAPVIQPRKDKEVGQEVSGVVDERVLLDFYLALSKFRVNRHAAGVIQTPMFEERLTHEFSLPNNEDLKCVNELTWAKTSLDMFGPSDTVNNCIGAFARNVSYVGIWRTPSAASIGTILRPLDMLRFLNNLHRTGRRPYPPCFLDRPLCDMHMLQPYTGTFFPRAQQTTLLQTLQGWKQAHPHEIAGMSIPIYGEDDQFYGALTLLHLAHFLAAPSIAGFCRPVGYWLGATSAITTTNNNAHSSTLSLPNIASSRRFSLPVLPSSPEPESVHLVQAIHASWNASNDVPAAHPGLAELSALSPGSRRRSLATTDGLSPLPLSPTVSASARFSSFACGSGNSTIALPSLSHGRRTSLTFNTTPVSPRSPASAHSPASASSSFVASPQATSPTHRMFGSKRALVHPSATIAQVAVQMLRERTVCLWCLNGKAGRATSYITANQILAYIDRLA